ncbi:kinase-like protein [Aulographum hederae CBS 113979]|uniref:Kinase-like protein n=1 Tax=Aulographum hederae CBS 113979 TaxID=1176131 RepID=A0A6G1GLV9_9PEZI|nr:kinase-like protein [Aulographum hederae CBS 113979]
MSDKDYEPHVRVISRYYPLGVKEIIGHGLSSWIGVIDDTTVLKYPVVPGEEVERFEAERQMLEHICPHPHIVQLKGYQDNSLFLERCVNGNLHTYLTESDTPPSLQQRLSWSRETAEAIAHCHSKRVLHCDLHPLNILLDAELHIKIIDFQGQLLSEDGSILIDGLSGGSTRFRCPREDICQEDIKKDLFALGCCIYYMMFGHPVYPDIIDGEEEWSEKVQARFAKKEFPQDSHACSAITSKCWLEQYESADDIVRDIKAVEKGLGFSTDERTNEKQ